MAVDLAKLAADASAQLGAIWDDLGVPAAERTDYLSGVCEQVAGVYSGSVARQRERMAGVQADIDRLRATIADMQFTMGEDAYMVRGGEWGVDGGRALPPAGRARARPANEAQALTTAAAQAPRRWATPAPSPPAHTDRRPTFPPLPPPFLPAA